MPKFSIDDAPLQPKQTYTSDDYAFANTVIDQLTRAKRLPLKLTPADVFNAIADNYLYWVDRWPDATMDDQLVFSTDVLHNPQKYLDAAGCDKRFKLLTNSVVMPPMTFGIYKVFYHSSAYVNRSLLNYANFNVQWMLLASTFGSYPKMDVDTYMGAVFCLNLLSSMSKQPAVHKYNQNNHVLQIFDLGGNTGYISAIIARMLPPSDFYNNQYFKMYIQAKVLDARADQLELFGSPSLPGDLQLNIGVLRTRAQNLMEEVNKMIDAELNSEYYIIKS